jgi:hypothetical protein
MNIQIKITNARRVPAKRRKVFRVLPEQSVFVDHYDYCFRWHNTTGRTQYVSVSGTPK